VAAEIDWIEFRLDAAACFGAAQLCVN